MITGSSRSTTSQNDSPPAPPPVSASAPVSRWPKVKSRTAVPVVELVVIPVGKVLGVSKLSGASARVKRDAIIHDSERPYLYLFVRHPITDTRIEFVQ
jgi:hypothetical protein